MNSDFIIKAGVLLKYIGNSTDIEIPDGVKVIDECVFLGRPITSVTMPDSVVEVRDKAFHECCELQSLRLSNNLETVGYCAFCGLSVKELKIPASVKTIAWGAFCDYRGVRLTKIKFYKRSKLERVEGRAFGMHPELKKVEIPAKLKDAFAKDAFDESCEIIWV